MKKKQTLEIQILKRHIDILKRYFETNDPQEAIQKAVAEFAFGIEVDEATDGLGGTLKLEGFDENYNLRQSHLYQ
jgi:hypothetical protein